MDLARIVDLEAVDLEAVDLEAVDLEAAAGDVFVGTGPRYPWGGLYGGQIVAQALVAAALTVEDRYAVHSLRAYFIRSGDADQPVRYEVDRTRDGRSFCTRRVVARQGAPILNLEASFQVAESSLDAVGTVAMDPAPAPDSLPESTWSTAFHRRWVPGTDAQGRTRCWFRIADPLADGLIQAAALAYLSDDLPTVAVGRAVGLDLETDEEWFSVSLDHTVWFHRPVRADQWHLHDIACHAAGDGRGLAIGHIFAPDGTHVATLAQEILLRRRRG